LPFLQPFYDSELRTVLDSEQKGFDECCLANARLAGDEHYLPLTIQGFVQEVVKLLKFSFLPNQGNYGLQMAES
jgi:hypothetical protein